MPACLEALDRLSLGVSLTAISGPLVERLGAVSFASDNSVGDCFHSQNAVDASRKDQITLLFCFIMNVLIGP